MSASANLGRMFMDEMHGRGPSKSMADQLADIKELQSKVSGIVLSNNSFSARNGINLSRGDVANLAGRWTALFVGKACDLECKFCPQPPKPSLEDDIVNKTGVTTSFNHVGSLDEISIVVGKACIDNRIDAVGISGGEPLLYLDRIARVLEFIKTMSPNTYVYLYTNGTKLNQGTAKELASFGIDEVRIDLAASNFSKLSLKALENASSWFPRVVVESPSLKDTFEKFSKHKCKIVDSGIQQINLCEMVINKYNAHHYVNEPYYIFNPYRKGGGMELDYEHFDKIESFDRLVPTWSRPQAYRVMDMFSDVRSRLTIHDISQGVHFKSEAPF
ncbi:radical SAM protein [Shimia sp. MMG029]|uniref:radical SAM protein n=1 Tax=Shimia sp. MMG029 TaxID=3021978 RepID=UPI0022FED780|nr:radical SAM protein [Shimia sp. MMG029]MDA5556032.1 radical SAM protein [Shimia sp. MMG029]